MEPFEPATRAVILARGLGTRMRAADSRAEISADQSAAADAGLKAMIPIGRPFLDYVISALADAGFTEVTLVIGPEHNAVRQHYTRTISPQRVRISFAIQDQPLGTAHALLSARALIGDSAFVVINADNYYPADMLRLVRSQREPALPAFDRDALLNGGNIPAERIARYALLDVGADGYLRRIVEKPDEMTVRALGDEAPVSMNCWLLTPAIFEACTRVPESARGERELPGAVQWAIDNMGLRVHAVPVHAAVLDLSHRGDIPAVAERLRGVEVSL